MTPTTVPEVTEYRELAGRYDQAADQTVRDNTDPPQYVIIRRPNRPTLQVGPFPFAHQAEHGSWTLRAALQGTTHVPGTTVSYSGGSPAYWTLPLLPDNAYDVALLMDDENDADPGERFPDLFDRLRVQLGETDGADLWRAACAAYDQMHTEADEQATV